MRTLMGDRLYEGMNIQANRDILGSSGAARLLGGGLNERCSEVLNMDSLMVCFAL